MSRQKRVWVYSPQKATPKIPELVKAGVQQRAEQLLEQTLRPLYVKPPPEEPQFNYVTKLYVRWRSKYFYFCAEYTCPGENAITPTFEAKFARMEWVGTDRFDLAFMRYTGEWIVLAFGISEQKCYDMITSDGNFQP